jgi:hypothetical protein
MIVPRSRTPFREVTAMSKSRSKWFLICCTAVSSCMHQPPQPDVNPFAVRTTIGARSDSQNRLFVKVHDAKTPTQALGFASVTVTRVGGDSIATSSRLDAQSRADGLAAFVLPDSGLYEIDVRLVRRASFRQRLRLAAACRQSLDIYLEEASVAFATPSHQESGLRSRGLLTTCSA